MILTMINSHDLTIGFFCLIGAVLVTGLFTRVVLGQSNRLINFLPNMAVSLGILGTFTGIYLGLLEFDVTRISDSVPELLEGLKTAFSSSNGRFTVHDLTADPIRTGIVRMNLRSNCISVLKSKNLYTHPFDLARYFKQFDSFTPKTIRKVEQVREIQTYSPKQADYSREYRKACNYQCQICGVNCREHPQMLPMHHIDGNPANNERSNLRILCAECHAAQPLHHHMLKNPEMVRQMTSIRALRRQQALLTVTAAP